MLKTNLRWFNDQLDYIKLKIYLDQYYWQLKRVCIVSQEIVTKDNGYLSEKEPKLALSDSVPASAGRKEIGGRVLHCTICVIVS